ncbi:MAG TPA: molybdopterin-dependent oxidoreductase [Acidimicrobiales bacterium]|nr:molybdopterin-dependent oxidoreductase [Acidimicrobiales bacterium]
MTKTSDRRTVFRTCPLCEATCGLELTLEGRTIVRVRGDRDDVLSRGFLCPKGAALRQLEADPDRVTEPQIRKGDKWYAVTWDDAFEEIDNRLAPVMADGIKDAISLYIGNANHSADTLFLPPLFAAAQTINVFTAGTADQVPKQLACALLFGHPNSIPVPDIDRTSLLVIFGANPLASNGSLFTAPGVKDRLAALQERGGRFIVIDPRRTPTASMADQHIPIQPGTDALFLLAVVATLFEERLMSTGRLAPYVNGVDELRYVASVFSADVVAVRCGVDPETIRNLARELARAPAAAVYGRLGTSAQLFGTVTSWLVDVVNVLTGNLDRPGGAMFPKAAAGQANSTSVPGRTSKDLWGASSRVSGRRQIKCVFPELPLICLPEEIDTPGPGRIRALITIGGNPLLSNPDSDRLHRALQQLELLVCVDIYRSETAQFAHVLLPAPSDLARPHYDTFFYQLACRNVANYSPPSVPLGPSEMREYEIFLRLAGILSGEGAHSNTAARDDEFAFNMVMDLTKRPGSPVHGRNPDELMKVLERRRGPERVLDLMVRTGVYGDGFGSHPGGLTLAELEAHPHGIDLGPLKSRVPEVIHTPSGRIELAPPEIIEDLARLKVWFEESQAASFLLINRRELRSNNSWMRNIDVLSRRSRCTAFIHSADAAALGILDQTEVLIRSRIGEIVVQVEITDEVVRGTISVPHGWGLSSSGGNLRVAELTPGVNVNLLTDPERFDALTGTVALSGVPVDVIPRGSIADSER